MQVRTKKKPSDFNCGGVQNTLRVIGGKWKPAILYLLLDDKLRFGELKRGVVGITQKMLTSQLREMEKDGLVNRKVYAQVPPKVEYGLTKKGQSLKPVMRLMWKWGREHQ